MQDRKCFPTLASRGMLSLHLILILAGGGIASSLLVLASSLLVLCGLFMQPCVDATVLVW